MSATIKLIEEAARRTLKARERVLQRHDTEAIIIALAQTAKNWLDPGNPWRQRAIEQAPSVTGFSSAMVNEAVDLTFSAMTKEALKELLLAGPAPTHKPAAGPTPNPSRGGESEPAIPLLGGARGGSMGTRTPVSPKLIAHFLAGNVPMPGIVSICCGLLLKSANVVKVSSRDPVFPALFVESLREVDAELADCVAVLDWRREELALTEAALAEADTVIAYGNDETIETLRRMCRPDARFLGYGHKLSLAVIAKEALTKGDLPELAAAAAFDAAVYDQQGCMSPHAFYVEEDGQLSPREFAAALAEAMAAYQARVPRGQLTIEEAAQIAKLRGAYEFRSATDKGVEVWASADTSHAEPSLRDAPPQAGTPVPPKIYEMASASWLVIFEEDPTFTPSCLNRVVFVKPIKQLESISQLVQRFASNLSTVGIAPTGESTARLAKDLILFGASRVCPVGQMQRPPLSLSP